MVKNNFGSGIILYEQFKITSNIDSIIYRGILLLLADLVALYLTYKIFLSSQFFLRTIIESEKKVKLNLLEKMKTKIQFSTITGLNILNEKDENGEKQNKKYFEAMNRLKNIISDENSISSWHLNYRIITLFIYL
jgi:hypothetical protein